MCGIAGILCTAPEHGDHRPPATAGLEIEQRAVAKMVGRLLHRGPDGHGCAVAGAATLPAAIFGHTRLAIIDLSAAGRQPMVSADGRLWVTFNGEIYNFHELRARLTPVGGWQSQSDTEVLLAAYARWGRDCLEHLRGMYAFAVWDAPRKELFLARDRFGIKPLYYYATTDGRFLFASEVRALLASGLVPPRLDRIALGQYLAYQCVPSPRTLIDGVRALPPGSSLVVDANGHATERRYWDLLERAVPDGVGASPETRARTIHDLLRESIALHLVSDVPVGVFLSGGIDSSVLVALMREAGHQARTFNVAFAERSFDEASHAREVARRFQSEHTEIALGDQDLLDQLPAALGAMDQPTGDGINTYVVAHAVRATGIKVALSGLGGDELFAGYPSFARLQRVAQFMRAWGATPRHLRASAGGIVRYIGRGSIAATKAAAMLESDGTLAALYPPLRQVLSDAQRWALLEPDWAEPASSAAGPYERLLVSAFASHRPGLLAHISYAEARTYMHDLLLHDTDQMSMAHALEVRVPLLDHRLAEYVVGLSDRDKQPNGTPKRLLVEALAGLLPESIVHRPKQGFALPFAPWMRGPLRTFCEDRLGPAGLGGRGIFRTSHLDKLWQDFLADRPNVSWSRLWLLVTLEEWLKRQEPDGGWPSS